MPGGLSWNVDLREVDAPRLVIVGEIDIGTASTLEEAANAVLDAKPRILVLDFTQVPFCDSSGVGVLVRLYNRAILVGCRLTVRNPVPNVRAVFEMTSLTRILRIEPDPSTAG